MQRFYCVELLRFLCASTVAIYHWGTSFEIMQMNNNDTFRNYLEILYDFGDYAVPVFFVISGLVFANVYLSQEKKETIRNFTVKRIARLYPLHLLTFISILLLQFSFLKLYGNYELYTFNDLKHFFLNITLLLGWGFEEGRSFNTPVWTVSQEIAIYYLFFVLISLINKYNFKLIFLIYFIFLLIDKTKFTETGFINDYINFTYFVDFVKLFFSGIFIYFLLYKFKNYKKLFFISSILLMLAFIGSFKLHLFCFSIVTIFVLIDKVDFNQKIKSIFIFLGNLTYSIYLLHTLTFLIMLLILKLLNNIDFFYTKTAFFLYLIFTFTSSIISFTYFESKMNKDIRNRFLIRY